GDGLAHVSAADPERCLARQEARFELGKPGRKHRRTDPLELLERFLVPPSLEQRIGAGERRLDAATLVGVDAVRQITRVDAEPVGEPADCLGGRLRLAPLDLADVLLREAVAGQLGLGHSTCHPQLPETLPEAKSRLGSRRPLLLLTDGGRIIHMRRSRRHASPNFNPPFRTSPKKGMSWLETSDARLPKIT